MKSLFSIFRRSKPVAISYEDSKRLVRDENPAVRADLAQRHGLRPEILYYLAEDPSPDVRRQIARNEKTPAQADRLLACDDDESVRQGLAGKLARLAPQLSAAAQEETQRFVLETLEILARDQAVRVRRILAETLHDLADAPPAVIQQLARDSAAAVACPVLEFSPLLTDQDLIGIIDEGCASGKLNAISRRRELAAPVTDAIVATADRDAITALLANTSAQIREETLDSLVEGARAIQVWQAPLVERPKLSPRTIQKLAGMVADNLLKKLQKRAELDQETAALVAAEVHRRLVAGDRRPGQAGEPNEETLMEAVTSGNRALVREILTQLSGLEADTIEKILEAGSAKGITALAWKAGLTMRSAMQLQLRLGGITPAEVLNARDGTEYPLSSDEMAWHLSLFETMSV